MPWAPLNRFVFDILCYPIDIFNGLTFSTIVIFCYYQLHNHNLLGGGNSNQIFGVICLDRGAISALAIGAISPRYAPGFLANPDFVYYLRRCIL